VDEQVGVLREKGCNPVTVGLVVRGFDHLANMASAGDSIHTKATMPARPAVQTGIKRKSVCSFDISDCKEEHSAMGRVLEAGSTPLFKEYDPKIYHMGSKADIMTDIVRGLDRRLGPWGVTTHTLLSQCLMLRTICYQCNL
jgi:hypothetical protein